MKDDPVLMESEVNRDPDAASEEAPGLLQVGKQVGKQVVALFLGKPHIGYISRAHRTGSGSPSYDVRVTVDGSEFTVERLAASDVAAGHQSPKRPTPPPALKEPRRSPRLELIGGSKKRQRSLSPQPARTRPTLNMAGFLEETNKAPSGAREKSVAFQSDESQDMDLDPAYRRGGGSLSRPGEAAAAGQGGAAPEPPQESSPSTQSPNPSSPASQLQPAPRGAPQRGDDRQARPTGRPRSFRQP